ncbi:hypothetical protein DRN74_04300 [Candidatus Micrarchaeota archaeon]|nr:MAG: hypothetical protein DRN74_04300 [Candidatus Micrarchaeota archaeon]
MTTVIILSSGKCSWGKCYACGWGRLEFPVDIDKMKKQVESLNLDSTVKVFSSGSFLDDKQFPLEFRDWFAKQLKSKGVKNLIIESIPQYITDENLSTFKGLNLTVAIGLEVADDEILEKYQKPFRIKHYLEAVETLHRNNCKVRTYLMVNMPFSKDIKKDLEKSVNFALKYSDSIVLINTFPHSKAPLFDDWVNGKWRPLSPEEFEEIVAPYKDNPKIETDAQNYAFRPKFPAEKQLLIEGASVENLKHPYFNVWQDYFQRFYKAPKGKDILLFLPCSFKKPYTSSSTHKAIYKTISKLKIFPRIHRVVVSTPGVVPIEFSDNHPFNAYDWPEWEETEELMKEYIAVTKDRVRKYLEAHRKHYKRVYAYMKYTESYEAVKQACDELGISCENLLDYDVWKRIKDEKNPIIKPLALSCLRKNLMKIK